MPPPPVNWQKPNKRSHRPPDPTRSGLKTEGELEFLVSHVLEAEKRHRRVEINKEIKSLVQDAQEGNAPVAKGSWITGKRNQHDLADVEAGEESDEDEEEMEMLTAYIRKGDNEERLPKEWKEVTDQPSDGTEKDKAATDKRTTDTNEAKGVDNDTADIREKRVRDDDEEPPLPKKRKLKADFCPAAKTTWKPSWLDTTQCYPVDQFGEDMSDVTALRGDEIHRNTEKLRRILEKECMYITTATVNDLLDIARDTVRLCKVPEQFLNGFPNKVRVERHKYK
jgi:hypothetical protein